jgi:Ubiquitin-like autophagy protein Apg12
MTEPRKIKVNLRPGPNAPIIEHLKQRTSEHITIATFVSKLRKQMPDAVGRSEQIQLTIAGSFDVLPEQRIGDLFDSFGVDDELTMQYYINED